MFSHNSFRFISFTVSCCRNHYDTLGVSPKATVAEIKAAYYKLSLRYHPDRQDGDRDQFERITEAYKVLGEAGSRSLYDRGAFDDTSKPRPSRNYHAQTSPTARKPNVPSGRTPIYDFDMWSRFHYGEAITRRNAAKAKHEENINQKSRQKGIRMKENFMSSLIAVMFTVSLSSLFYRSMFDDFDKPVSPPRE